MAILTSKFDVLRGWPKEGAIDETFPIYSPGGVPTAITSGTIVYLRTDGTVAPATVGGTPAPVWMVVEGNDDYSGAYLQKAVCLRSNCVVRTAKIKTDAAETYPVNTQLTYQGGMFRPAAVGEQIIGEVWKDDRAVDGSIVVYFHAGMSEVTA